MVTETASEATAKALFFGGVTRRFPELNSGFLEGGAGWACSLYADLIGHWEKRKHDALDNTNPASLDQAKLLALAEKYAQPAMLEAVRRAIPAGSALVEFAAYHPFDPKAPMGKRYGPAR